MPNNNNNFTVNLLGNNNAFDHAINASESLFNQFTTNIINRTSGASKGINHMAARFAIVNQAIDKGLNLAGRAFGALVGGLESAIKKAGDLNEVLNYTQVIFGANFGKINSFADDFSRKFGVAKKEVLEMSAQFGEMAIKNGKSSDEAAKFAETMVKRAADVASLRNTTAKDAADKMISTLQGNHRAGRGIGIYVSEERIRQHATEKMGGQDPGKVPMDSKFQLRSELIMKDTNVAAGDLQETMGSLNNQIKIASGNWDNLGTAIGGRFVDAAASALQVVNKLFGSMFESLENGELGNLVNSLAYDFGSVAESIGTTSSTFDGFISYFSGAWESISVVYRNWSLIAERTGVLVGGYVYNFGEIFGWLGSVIGTFVDWFGKNFTNLIVDYINIVGTALGNLGTNFQNLGSAIAAWLQNPSKPFQFTITPLFDGLDNLKTEALNLPQLALSSVDDQLSAIDDKMVENEVKRADAIDAAEKKRKQGPPPTKRGQNVLGNEKTLMDDPAKITGKLKGVEMFGITDFSKHLQTQVGKDDTAKEALKEAKKQTALQEKLVNKNNMSVALMSDSD